MALTQAERARNYRKRKAEERAAARASQPPDPTPREPSRQKKRDRARADRVKRAIELLEQPVPPRAELLDEAIRTLRSVGLDPGAGESSRVAAGRALLSWASGAGGGADRGAQGSEAQASGAASSGNGGGDANGPPRAPTLDEALQ